MASPRNFRVRNRAFYTLLIPVVIVLWLAGWALYWRGSQNAVREKKTIAEDDLIEMRVAVFEEYEESKN